MEGLSEQRVDRLDEEGVHPDTAECFDLLEWDTRMCWQVGRDAGRGGKDDVKEKAEHSACSSTLGRSAPPPDLRNSLGFIA